MKISSLADWVGIISGAITIIVFLNALAGWFPPVTPDPGGSTGETLPVAIIAVVFVCVFFFWAQHRVALRFGYTHDDFPTFLVAIAASAIGGVLCLAVEWLVVAAMAGTDGLVYWLVLTAVAWIAASFFSVPLAALATEDGPPSE